MKPYDHCIDSCRFIRDGKCAYNEMHVRTVAVDFDRVLFTHEKWQGHSHYGEPLPFVVPSLLILQKLGFKIMIWTTRAQKEIIAGACAKHGIPYDYINENPNQPPEINPSKPVADYYIDDRAVHFKTWPAVVMEIERREREDPYYRSATSVPPNFGDVISLSDGEPEKVRLLKDLMKVRIAQGIGGMSIQSMLSYLDKSLDELKEMIEAVCTSSGCSLEKLRWIAEGYIEREKMKDDRDGQRK